MNTSVTGFLSLFEEKLGKLKKKIKAELEKDKKDRNTKTLRSLLAEAKSLQKTVRKMQTENLTDKCPHCGGEL